MNVFKLIAFTLCMHTCTWDSMSVYIDVHTLLITSLVIKAGLCHIGVRSGIWPTSRTRA